MSPAAILKVSVLRDGSLLLDGAPATPGQLSEALHRAPRDAVVWYYRENAAGEAPAVVPEVIKLFVERRLKIRLSSKPDFSDEIAPQAASSAAGVFAAVRARAAGRHLVVLRPDGRQAALPAMPRDAVSPDALANIEKLLPSSTPRSVAVLADTSWAMEDGAGVAAAARAIPFFGLLMGLATIGHAVRVFDGGTAAALADGCRDADLAIVDSARIAALPERWHELVRPLLRGRLILVHDRATYQLRKI